MTLSTWRSPWQPVNSSSCCSCQSVESTVERLVSLLQVQLRLIKLIYFYVWEVHAVLSLHWVWATSMFAVVTWLCAYVWVCVSLCVCLSSIEQYAEDAVDIEVSVNGDVVGRRRLSYTISSLSLAYHLSKFYCRLLSVACHHHHHHQQQQQQQHVDSSSLLDKALVNAIDDKSCTVASQTLFTVYRQHHCTRKLYDNSYCQCVYLLGYT